MSAMEETSDAARSALDPEWQRAFRFIEDTVGGKIVRHHRHPRWRPAFDVDVECQGRTIPVHFRGERPSTSRGFYGIRHEYKAFQVCEKEGVLVPHVYGFCEDPEGIVLERSPGRPNLATAESQAEREAVLDEYLQNLVKMHAIDSAVLEAEGFERPAPERVSWCDFAQWVDQYERAKPAPDPTIAFTLAWLDRNMPRRDDVAFVHGDSGQFIFEKGHLTAVLDLELAHLGDPANDLGALLCRDLSEPLGDLSGVIARYSELSGRAMDAHIVNLQAIRFAICTPMSVLPMVHRPSAELEPVQYVGWYHVYARMPIELMAHVQGVELDEPSVPEPETSRFATGFDALRDLLAKPKGRDGFEAYQIETAARLAQYLQRCERYGPALEADDLDEVSTLIGRRPSTWREADAALEAFVMEAPPDRDAEILRYLYRRHLRQIAILEPVLKEMRDTRVQKLS